MTEPKIPETGSKGPEVKQVGIVPNPEHSDTKFTETKQPVLKDEPKLVLHDSKKDEENRKKWDEEKKKEDAEKVKQRDELLDKIQQILHKYDGLEANIPLNSEYWDLLNRFRGLQ